MATGSADARLPKRSPPKIAEKVRKELRQRADLRIEALGSGTDFTAFLDHLGIATLDLAYGGEDEQGIYHSIYDDFYWYTHFSDTDFVYGRALAQTVGTSVMRLADAEVLPFDFVNLADTVEKVHEESGEVAGRQAGRDSRAQPGTGRRNVHGDV